MTTRLYEGLFLFDANETAKGWSEVESMINGMIEKHGGSLEFSERWPDQRLAYDIEGVRKGTYYLTYFRTDSLNIEPLRADAALNERILRVLVIQEDWLEQEMERRRENASKPRSAPEPEQSAASEENAGDAAESTDRTAETTEKAEGDDASKPEPAAAGAGEESQD